MKTKLTVQDICWLQAEAIEKICALKAERACASREVKKVIARELQMARRINAKLVREVEAYNERVYW